MRNTEPKGFEGSWPLPVPCPIMGCPIKSCPSTSSAPPPSPIAISKAPLWSKISAPALWLNCGSSSRNNSRGAAGSGLLAGSEGAGVRNSLLSGLLVDLDSAQRPQRGGATDEAPARAVGGRRQARQIPTRPQALSPLGVDLRADRVGERLVLIMRYQDGGNTFLPQNITHFACQLFA